MTFHRVPTHVSRSFAALWRGACAAGLGVIGLVIASSPTQNAIANGDTRTINLLHKHTGETILITFRQNGRYDQEALKKLNWFLRDWRTDQPTRMDPELFDLIWEVYRAVGGQSPVHVVSAYRSEGTNAMLRRRSRAVAKFSQHIQGRAMDFYIPGISMAQVREVGIRLQRGGVGFYPGSANNFVHMDTGSVRHWPKVSRDYLARLFPDGRTVHIPTDGKPMPGYELAAAEVRRRGGVVTRGGDSDEEYETYTASADTNGPIFQRGRGNLFAGLFGSSQDEQPARRPTTPVLTARPAAAPPPIAVAAKDDEDTKPAAPQPRTGGAIILEQAPIPLRAPAERGADIVLASVPVPMPRPRDAAPSLDVVRQGEMIAAGRAEQLPDVKIETASLTEAPVPLANPNRRPYLPALIASGTSNPEPEGKATELAYALASAATQPAPAPRPETTVRRAPAPAKVSRPMTAPLTAPSLEGNRSDVALATVTPGRDSTANTVMTPPDARFGQLLEQPRQTVAASFAPQPVAIVPVGRFSGSATTALRTVDFEPADMAPQQRASLN